MTRGAAFFLVSAPERLSAPSTGRIVRDSCDPDRSPTRTRVRHLMRSRLLYFCAVLSARLFELRF